MKDLAFMAAILFGCVIVLGALFLGFRHFNNATAIVAVVEVEPGVRCAKMVTTDGAAISCWKTEQPK